MEAAGVLRSSVGTKIHMRNLPEKPSVLATHASSFSLSFSDACAMVGRPVSSARIKQNCCLPFIKASGAATVATSSDSSAKSSVPSDNKGSLNSIFSKELEALVLEVCDETDVAELKLKVGDFEMLLKRNIGALKSPPHIVSPTTAPPIPSEPMVESAPVTAPVTPQKSSQVSTNPFSNVASAKTKKLAALEASGTNAYVLVSSPTVGSFRSGKTIKGKKQPPSCKEGDLINEGEVIGYIDQFGNELPVKSDVAGEILKILFMDGEAVGYGEPLVAVLPSFHGINK